MATASTTSSRAACKEALATALASAARVIATAKAGGYTTIASGETAINGVRAQLHNLIPEICSLWGADGNASVRALRALGGSLLDLRALLTDTDATIIETLAVETSLIRLATTWYGDFSRYTELADLNPHLPTPGRIPAGTEIVRRAQ